MGAYLGSIKVTPIIKDNTLINEILSKTISGSYINRTLESAGMYAFAFCSYLTSVDLPACTSIRDDAFSDCISLYEVNLPICTTISNYAFYNCSALTSVSLPVCTSIGTYAFAKCSSLTSVSLPACTSISPYAFYRCTSLASVSFPVCTSIGPSAFQSCYNLLSLYLTGSSICNLANTNAFTSTPISNYTTSTGGVYGSIYVPASLVNSYKTAAN